MTPLLEWVLNRGKMPLMGVLQFALLMVVQADKEEKNRAMAKR